MKERAPSHRQILSHALQPGFLASTAQTLQWDGQPHQLLLLLAATGDDADLAAAVLNAGADVNYSGYPAGMTALHRAAAQGATNVTRLLLARGALVDAFDNDGETPLNQAATFGHPADMRALLEAGADPSNRALMGGDLVELARESGNSEAVAIASKALKRKRKASTEPNATEVIGVGTPEDLQKLLAAPGARGFRDKKGRTLLHIAAEAGRLEAVEALLKSGADLEARAVQGFTPLHYAAQRGHAAVVRHLVRAGADTGAPAARGLTPLVCATQSDNDLACFEALLARGASVSDLLAKADENLKPAILASLSIASLEAVGRETLEAVRPQLEELSAASKNPSRDKVALARQALELGEAHPQLMPFLNVLIQEVRIAPPTSLDLHEARSGPEEENFQPFQWHFDDTGYYTYVFVDGDESARDATQQTLEAAHIPCPLRVRL